MAIGSGGGSASVPSLPPPRPMSPPEYPDLYGKRRQLAKAQMLEREISILEEELKFVEGLQPASRCCKEVVDFVVANSDPLIPTSQKSHKSCRFWKWLCHGSSCFNLSWTCCFRCSPRLGMPRCCNCHLCNFHSCFSCSIPKSRCCSTPCSSCTCTQCIDKIFCCSHCGVPQCPSYPASSCRWRCSCLKCPKVDLCSCCTKNCCYPCFLCF